MTEPELLSYILEWQEDSDPLSIKALYDDDAFNCLAEAMGITLKDGRPTEGDFLKAGGKAFLRGTVQIFPPKTLPLPAVGTFLRAKRA